MKDLVKFLNKEFENFHLKHKDIFTIYDYGFSEVESRWSGILDFDEEISEFSLLQNELKAFHNILSNKYPINIVFFYTLRMTKGYKFWDKPSSLRSDTNIIEKELSLFQEEFKFQDFFTIIDREYDNANCYRYTLEFNDIDNFLSVKNNLEKVAKELSDKYKVMVKFVFNLENK